jgi:hypothetical protein
MSGKKIPLGRGRSGRTVLFLVDTKNLGFGYFDYMITTT